MKTSRILIVAVLAMMVLASSAFAQRGDGGGQRRGGMMGGQRGGMMGGMMGGQRGGQRAQSEVQLLSRPDVQKDIKLTAKQKTKLEAFQAEQQASMQTRMEEMRGGGGSDGGRRGSFDRDAMMAEFEKSRKEAETKVKAILTKEQWTRLGEIKIHMMGPRAVLDEEIQKKLKIKASQTLEITKLTEALGTANQAIYTRMRDPGIDREALQKELENNNKYFEQELAKILTADQKKMLDGMKGKPFKQDMDYRPERGRGGFGGGGGG